ncbi:hypothetical protein JWS13_17635 [Rhodococcus pseudokoreensis]|uniref:Uncharacterized protein n=1 Tax=Rhodococcus pseudokoreensis TaxID=2811421 RepID=A0A974ZU07_9NOCA|nr:hypothetical protein [Rhodococcus pseudokoreensis]QSE90311.1 hypothetical protein JWS13_17635 [Rhodococcus pseudokoreensis]
MDDFTSITDPGERLRAIRQSMEDKAASRPRVDNQGRRLDREKPDPTRRWDGHGRLIAESPGDDNP